MALRLDRLDDIVGALDSLLGKHVRLWRIHDGTLELVAGARVEEPRLITQPDGSFDREGCEGVFAPVNGAEGYYFECGNDIADRNAIASLLGRLLAVERDTLGVAEELSARYEEIDLLYTISDILGRTIGLEEAAEVIVREVSSVVGARRASIFVYDDADRVLRPVAGWGLDLGEFGPIPVEDPHSIAARVYRENTSIAGNASELDPHRTASKRQPYRGNAFLSAAITYPDPNGASRPVGVINLTDRLGSDSFSSGDRKLVAAIAHQIGAAIENARLVVLDRERQKARHDLEVAHDLQLRLLPSPQLIGNRHDVWARCSPGELVGGDFYQFVPLPDSRIGVMLGDVSTHGLPAALIMALVLSAAGIHAAASNSPEQALQRLLASVRSELSTTEMFLSLFYGIVDRKNHILRYANAGHPHAFVLPGHQPAIRLQATVPPLGLADADDIVGSDLTVSDEGALLLVFSDGLTDARDASGHMFSEQRVIDLVHSLFDKPADEIVDRVFAEVEAFAASAVDDQTMIVLRI